MARMVPPRAADQFTSSAERTLYHELRTQLSDEYLVLHSVAWLAREGGRNRDGEADFVVLHPRHGALLIEVKGGAISRDGVSGDWHSTDSGGDVHDIHDPFAQASRNMYALRDKLAASPSTAGLAVHLGRAVAFPDVIVLDEQLGAEAPRSLIIDSSDLTTLIKAIHRAWGAASTQLGAAGVNAIAQLLRPPIELSRPGLVGAMRAERAELIQLTGEQVRVLEFIGGHRRAAIAGTAGSGKTLVAMEAARRFARQGYRVLFTCFTKALAAWVQEELARDLAPDELARVTVDNYHELAERFVQESGSGMPGGLDGDALNRYFQEELPERLMDALDRLPHRFDAIVVDEGQDFADSWWVTLEAMLANPSEGALYLFYDDNQRIFDQQGDYPIPPPHFPLASNCRTTRAIHDAASAYLNGAPAAGCRGPAGRPPVELPVEPGEEIAALRRALHELVTVEGVALEEIVVLTPRSRKTSLFAEGTKLGNLSLTWGDAGVNQVRCRSIQAFKGLESPVVVLAEADRSHPKRRANLMHVALTRATHHVVALGPLPAVPA